MMDLIEKIYLTPSDNEAIPVLKCFFCEEDVYTGLTGEAWRIRQKKQSNTKDS